MNLEPRRGACYRVIAGMRRLRAAHRICLNTVPCLVHDADEERLADMCRARDGLRWGVLTDLAAVEISRTKAVGTADEMLRSDAAIERSSADYLALVSDVVSAVSTEAPSPRRQSRPGPNDSGRDVLDILDIVRAQITTIRPALVVECQLRECVPELSVEVLARFFEAGWRDIRAARMEDRYSPHWLTPLVPMAESRSQGCCERVPGDVRGTEGGSVGSGLKAHGSWLRQNPGPLTRRSCLSPKP